MRIRLEIQFEEMGFGFDITVKGRLLDVDGPKWLQEVLHRKEYFRYDKAKDAASWIQEAEEEVIEELKRREEEYQKYLSFKERYSLVKEVIL